MNRVLIILLFIASGAVVSCSHENGNQLLGTWERVEEINKEPQLMIGGSNDNEKIEVLLSFRNEASIKN